MWGLIVIIFCLGFNAFLAATELAFVAIGKPRLRKLASDGDEHAVRVLKLRENPERTLSVLQLGITFVGVVAAAVGGVGSDGWLTPYLMERFGLSHRISEVLSILIFVVPYTYLSLVLSELLPKSLALRNPKKVIFRSERWVYTLSIILAPVVFLLEKSTKIGVKLCSSWVKPEEGEPEEPIHVGKLLRPYMVNLAKIEKKKVKDVMIPWSETDKISVEARLDEVKEKVLETKHTRMPVLENGRIVGILQTKEFMAFYEKGGANWQEKLVPLIQMSEEETLINALKLLQGKQSHMGIVFHGKDPTGMVTIEDILEEVVGEIYDEDDLTR